MLTNEDARAIATGEGVDTHTARQTAHELIATGTYFDHGQAMLNLLNAFEDVQTMRDVVFETVSELEDILGELGEVKTAAGRSHELDRMEKAIEALGKLL